MFAPYCPTCQARVLLGARRIVRFRSVDRGHRVLLRCHCDTVVRWDDEAPAEPDRATA